ncbi:tagatose 1,6-diphosphate aldolase [Tuwongella immobilis]|uniref:Tagatose-bisphosphate aldolase n=1 Tax=Tuwongella immobilis TaxID=692036 RepID=A0A6C2YLY3_9BACT|nr:tagatose 1,6-diphosphate aldolase [Tuwongella immobilis]VIP02436.1 tagatose-bisphosphate aldolase : Tagatose-bisphosphate aldolase OS=Isosphaera pallida (strain ATCC 43644 / DSM 9630 / IS1B) GN=Isop_0943 PE=4 SV=1: DeoC [Tuwongella immobilis]VTS01392.1 tagatose-bisphosphate aldolase : Tagatose-bisphosphate aldolase OS=Isosphaera pallida (strain ATCC 43644 / DSM 9630 / IS1B) GN=Isop_0943 PE=4 SV=1: DeoC [Tuwongella immobilis]
MASKLSVTRLLGLGLTPGKLRGLQRISNPNGTLTMVATDQNSSMINMIKDSLKKKGEDREPTYEEIVEAKIMLAGALSPHASAILVDAYYGVWNSVASFAIPPQTGLLVRVEKSGGGKNKHGAPLGAIEPGWSVEKIKQIGADAVKLLAQFEPGELHSAEHQYEFIQKIYEDCKKHDILLLLETVAFPYGGEKKDSESALARKAEVVIESARYLSRFCDIYKAEFPGYFGRETDEQLIQNLKELDRVCERPWVLLSAGVDFPAYKKQVEMAMKCGASGVLGGRAFWKEYFTFDTPEQRHQFATVECADRVKQIHDIVTRDATPWYARYELNQTDLSKVRVAEGWHFRYFGDGTAIGAGPAKADKDAVY